MILLIALATSFVLTLLLVTSVMARCGLRGGVWPLLAGIAAGGLIGPLERMANLEHNQVLAVVEPLALQFVAIGLLRSLILGVLVAAAIALMIAYLGNARRRGDIWNVAAGIGLGLGISSTMLALDPLVGQWPPFLLVTAISNAPFQLCFALIIASAVLKSRFDPHGNGPAPATVHALAIGLQTIYQSINIATHSIGHWIAWMEPTWMGILWLILICLFWATGLALFATQRLTPPPAQHQTSRKRSSWLLRPWLWQVIAGLVLLPAAGLFLLTWLTDFNTALGRMMIYTFLAVPLLAGGVFLRTAMALSPGRAAETQR